MKKPFTVLFAGGGTGGHIFPALAIAENIQKRFVDARIEFVGSTQGLETKIIPKAGFRLHCISVSGLYRVGKKRQLLALLKIPFALLHSTCILWRLRPHAVIGVGGYASGPVLLCALVFRFNTIIQEQNTSPGMTNRFLGRYVNLAFIPFEDSSKTFKRSFQVGNPIRRDIQRIFHEPLNKLNDQPLRITVLGGSRGARPLNQVIPATLPLLKNFSRALFFLHQTGENEYEYTKKAYTKNSIAHEIFPFIEDIADIYRKTDLIISRAGSGIFELTAAGRASILIPIPWASGDHQRQNALFLEKSGAAIMIEEKNFTPEALAQTIKDLLSHPEKIERMQKASRALYPGDSAAKIVDTVLQQLKLEKCFSKTQIGD